MLGEDTMRWFLESFLLVVGYLRLSLLIFMLSRALWIHLQPHPLLGLATLNHPQLGVPWNCVSRCIRHTAATVLLHREDSWRDSPESFCEASCPLSLHVRVKFCFSSPDLEQTSTFLCTLVGHDCTGGLLRRFW